MGYKKKESNGAGTMSQEEMLRKRVERDFERFEERNRKLMKALAD